MEHQYIRSEFGTLINTDDSYYRAIVSQREVEKANKAIITEVDSLKHKLEHLEHILKQFAVERSQCPD